MISASSLIDRSAVTPSSTQISKSLKGMPPFLKWAGGKRALIHQILPHMKEVGGTYFEPFLGGAAIFFALLPQTAVLSDVNSELIECYGVLQGDPESLSKRLAKMPNSEEDYYRIRESKPRTEVGRAARFVYLTSLSFNGIYRQNLKGAFNVPYGYKVDKQMPTLEQLIPASQALRKTRLKCGDFEDITNSARAGDVIYFDPPYTVAHNNNGFVKYNASIFSWDDQRRLAAHATKLVRRGCSVFVSNADHSSVRQLYRSFNIKLISRHSVIAANSANRGPITECLFVS